MRAPIKYFGGKGGQYKTIISQFPDENTWNKYLEPFGGSGVVLLNKKKCDIEIWNDLEHNVFSLFWVLIDKELFEVFKDLCDKTYYSESIRNHFNSMSKEGIGSLDTVEKAYRFFILNRMNYNGVGGFSVNTVVRKGMSKSVRDFLASIEGLEGLHQRLSSVSVYNRDALELIKKYDKEGFLFYLDPPYVKDSRKSQARYVVDQDDEFHENLIDALLNLRHAKVCLSGYENNIYDRLEWRTYKYKSPLSSSVECLWMNY